MIWNVTVPLLAVAVVVLLWRVWRLEVGARATEDNAKWMLDCLTDKAPRLAVNALSERVASDLREANETSRRLSHLARALGYEWKRTEAKEGWEKRVPIVGRTMAWSWADEAPKYPFPVTDRRKGDRRKAVIAKAADDPFPSPLDRVVTRKKKPRRAH